MLRTMMNICCIAGYHRRMGHIISPLSSVASLHAGNTFRGSLHDEPSGGVSVLAMALAESDLHNVDVELPKIAFQGDIERLQPESGDVLFRARGVNNRSIYVESVRRPCIFATPLVRIRVNDPQQLAPRYLHWVLNSPAIQQTIRAQARGSMISMVSMQSLRSLQIPIPPIRVQHEIAEVAHLLRQERALSEALMEKTQIHAEQVLWAAAQEVR